jgi:hypothetical protein
VKNTTISIEILRKKESQFGKKEEEEEDNV